MHSKMATIISSSSFGAGLEIKKLIESSVLLVLKRDFSFSLMVSLFHHCFFLVLIKYLYKAKIFNTLRKLSYWILTVMGNLQVCLEK
jgi:hypothetical protein